MKKILELVAGLALVVGMLFPLLEASRVEAASDSDTAQVGVTVAATISISAPADVDLGTITGTGASSEGSATWTVTTNNSGGYKLEWQADAAAMTNANSDTIAAYTPASADTPETWSVAADASEWGGRLKSASDDSDAEWGTDDTDENWLNVDNSAVREIVQRTTETSSSGSDEIVEFKAEVGSSKFQPTGDYTVNVTATATTL